MKIVLRPTLEIEDPEQVILYYYRTMGKGVHAYDQAKLTEDNHINLEQLKDLKRLVDKLGGRGIPHSAISILGDRKLEIEKRLQDVPSAITILAEYAQIPWDSLGQLIDILRVRGLGLARLTKMLHKKRPKIVPILDSILIGYLRPFIDEQTTKRVSEGDTAVCFIKEFKKDLDTNRLVLTQLNNSKRMPYPVSAVRILDILVWSTHGPFRNRFAHLFRC